MRKTPGTSAARRAAVTAAFHAGWCIGARGEYACCKKVSAEGGGDPGTVDEVGGTSSSSLVMTTTAAVLSGQQMTVARVRLGVALGMTATSTVLSWGN